MTGTSTLTARNPEDLLAVVRVVLGFEPADSIVMLTLGGRHPCHARVDLPDVAGDLPEVVEVLLRPALGHGAAAVVFVVYTDDGRQAGRAARLLRKRFEGAGIRCLETLRADAGRWHPLLPPAGGRPVGGPDRRQPGGVAYDVSTHPFVVAAVLDGRVLHGSRDELAATLAPRADEVAAVEAALPQPATAGPWVARTVARHASDGSVPSVAESARLLVAISDPEVRDAAWAGIRRAEARRHVELWSALVRRCPADLLPHAAGVLGIAAWLAGDGALAWCAVARAREVDPDHSLARLVADLLEAAVPPDSWEARSSRWGSAS